MSGRGGLGTAAGMFGLFGPPDPGPYSGSAMKLKRRKYKREVWTGARNYERVVAHRPLKPPGVK